MSSCRFFALFNARFHFCGSASLTWNTTLLRTDWPCARAACGSKSARAVAMGIAINPLRACRSIGVPRLSCRLASRRTAATGRGRQREYASAEDCVGSAGALSVGGCRRRRNRRVAAHLEVVLVLLERREQFACDLL